MSGGYGQVGLGCFEGIILGMGKVVERMGLQKFKFFS
jgi:hypothetical protein